MKVKSEHQELKKYHKETVEEIMGEEKKGLKHIIKEMEREGEENLYGKF